MDELLAWMARGLVDDPGAVRVERVDEGDVLILRLHVAPDDVGKVIGRHGRVARALRTVVRSGGARGERRLVLEIADCIPRLPASSQRTHPARPGDEASF